LYVSCVFPSCVTSQLVLICLECWSLFRSTMHP
jgi:hypothetical protein